MKLVLHIGTEKTGTTTIQEYLYQNRSLFEENGYYIPKMLGDKNHRKVPSYCMREKRFDNFHYDNFINTVEEKIVFQKQFEQELSEEFSNLPEHIHTVIISSEHFHSRLIFQNEVDKVKEIFSPFFDEFQIVVYLRRQIDVSVSLYSTFLIGGNGSIDINEFIINKCKEENHYYNYEIFLSLWENTFGRDALEVRLFSKDTFYKNDLLLDFTHTVTEDSEESFLGKMIIPEMKNESLSSCGQEIMKMINRHVPRFLENRKPNKLFIKLRLLVIANCIGKGGQPDPAIVKKMLKEFEVSNEKVKQKYFPERKTLFDSELVKPRQAEAVMSKEAEKMFLAMIQMLIRTYNTKMQRNKKR